MCGIVGKINFQSDHYVHFDQIKWMADSLRHRGPDDEGIWVNRSVGLGQRRLSIIDLSEDGRNPMCNEDGTVWITFNGEIYNFQELRSELEAKGHKFRSRTDTEVIVHLYEEYGSALIQHLRGMFAFALWDTRLRQLMLVRDRLGVKPLYYSLTKSGLLFGSEIKAILASGEISPTPDSTSIHQFLLWQCIPSPRTGFNEIKKLPPASFLLWQAKSGVRIEKYWELDCSQQLDANVDEITERVENLTEEATRIRLVADVPVGIFLSGGIDSACVLAAARKSNSKRIKTFSVSFSDKAYDESRYARIVAKHFDTDHHEFEAGLKIMDVLPQMARLFDEPFADAAAVPTYYLSKLTRQHVTVALSGDGGDEAFGGYDRYKALKALGWFSRVPGSKWLKSMYSLIPYSSGKHSRLRYARELLKISGQEPQVQYTSMFLGMFGSEQWKSLYSADFRNSLNGEGDDNFLSWDSNGRDNLSRAMAADTQRYIPDCLNVKVDICSMAFGLEVRSPFLDHKLIEFAARIPSRLKIHGMKQKYILKRAFAKDLPAEILRRGKSGFSVPLAEWFRGDLREFARDTLTSKQSNVRSMFQLPMINQMFEEHAAGTRNWHVQLWRLLILENWLQATAVSDFAHA
jgi:asparagine synthase (glutamine-hydrolysing)